MKKISRDFFARNTLLVAQELLGCTLVHKINGVEVGGKIVEVEGYMGPGDKAAHSYNGRRTNRNEIMYGEAGYAYVFVIYGMYNCFNIVTEEVDIPRAVLIRALEPTVGINDLANNRFSKDYEQLTKYEIKNLTNGPGKLCKALNITREDNGEDLCGDKLYLYPKSSEDNFEMVSTKRVNIDYAEEAIHFPWRYYIKGNKHVSKI